MSARLRDILGMAVVGVAGLAVLILTPILFELDTVLNVTVYLIMAVLALSLALIWGFGCRAALKSEIASVRTRDCI